MDFFNSDIFNYIILPLIIFCLRICDVSIGTLRIILVSKGNKFIAPLLGFFEVFIWILAISRIMQNLNNIFCFIGYAAGFATGNYIGMLIEEKLAIGKVIIRIITPQSSSELFEKLNISGFGVTKIQAKGSREDVDIVFTIIKRSSINEVEKIIKEYNPQAFYTIEDVKCVSQGVFPMQNEINNKKLNIFRRWRKGI